MQSRFDRAFTIWGRQQGSLGDALRARRACALPSRAFDAKAAATDLRRTDRHKITDRFFDCAVLQLIAEFKEPLEQLRQLLNIANTLRH